MYEFIIGIDVSKDFFDVSYYSNHDAIYLGQYVNSSSGFAKSIEDLKTKTELACSKWFICFENTGVYSKSLLEWLISKQINCREENPMQIHKSQGIRRGKNDKADSKVICLYAYRRRDSIQPTKLERPIITALKKLLSRRYLLVRQRTALINSLSEQKKLLDQDLLELFENQNIELILIYSSQIKEIERRIKALMRENEPMNRNNQLAQSVVGIGPITGAYIIAFTDNFNSFHQSRKFASYTGIAPFLHNQSGNKSGDSRVSQMANKRIKSLLSNGVNSAIQWDPEIRMYYERKISEGKEKGVVINAIKNKLIHRVFSVIDRQTPYVKSKYYT